MNSRKFYLIISILLSVFLFAGGTFALAYISQEDSQEGFIGDVLDSFRADKDPMNILLLGGDYVNGNTDTIMLINLNPSTGKINLLSIPRDSKVSVKGSSLPKINSAYPIGGPDLAIKTISNFLGVNIKHYVYIDTSAFRLIIDKLGGVDYYVPVDMKRDDPVQNLHINLKKGQQHLNGAKAEQFMRFREYNDGTVNKFYDGSDIKRIEAQQGFIKALIDQKVTISNLPKLKGVLNIVFNKIKTDMDLDEVMKLAQCLGNVSTSNMSTFTLPGRDSNEPNGWFYVIDMNKASAIIKNNFAGTGNYVDSGNNEKDTSNTNKTGTKKSNSNQSTPSKTTKPPATDTTKDTTTKDVTTVPETTKPPTTNETDNIPSGNDTNVSDTTKPPATDNTDNTQTTNTQTTDQTPQ